MQRCAICYRYLINRPELDKHLVEKHGNSEIQEKEMLDKPENIQKIPEKTENSGIKTDKTNSEEILQNVETKKEEPEENLQPLSKSDLIRTETEDSETLWKCGNCGQLHDYDFEVCGNCGMEVT